MSGEKSQYNFNISFASPNDRNEIKWKANGELFSRFTQLFSWEKPHKIIKAKYLSYAIHEFYNSFRFLSTDFPSKFGLVEPIVGVWVTQGF